ncbi:MAG: polyprenyl synthetase family protein [Candidatus Altiarchaeota archaeon]|nr:polyprenyl synthetase family protein [Candidatus Altiarchaeota archaeon]
MDFSRFQPVMGEVDSIIESTLEGKPENLYNASSHIITAGGKRVRPLLCILACRAVGGTEEDAFSTAAALELTHNFTLIHDDIMDNDDLRRGKKSVHKVYGHATAILAGDLLFSKAFELCDNRATKILARASARICEGQEMDMSFEERVDVTEQEYIEMIEGKTAVLLEAAVRSGAVLGNGSEDEIDCLASFGLNVGLAFQIKDDVLGVTADEEKLGKPVGSDVIEGKKNLLVIKALELLDDEQREKLTVILSKKDNTDVEVRKAISLIEKSRAMNYCRERMDYYCRKAGDSLMKLRESDARDDLVELSGFITERDF